MKPDCSGKMKISIVVSVPEAKFPVAYRREVARSLEKAKELDYDGVELSFTEPDKVNVGLLRELVGSLGLEVPALATGLSYVHFGLSFADRDPVVRDATVRRVKEYIRLASELGSAVVVGLIRGKAGEDAPLETAWGWNVECLKDCAREAEELGVTLALEPLNRYETDIVNTVDDGLRLISEIGS
ncbi:TPA: sugar phosphate isomerase/epimerase, partial [Candidatus Bathyarchaeota archaeon]|nr:sugar phosphate isomerase/epimerase [Candidatus Bathyarchaeota archaeon]